MWCHLVYMLAVVTEGWAPEAIWCEMITWVMSFDYIWFQATHLLHSCSRHRRMNSGGHRSSARNENLLPLKAAIGGDDLLICIRMEEMMMSTNLVGWHGDVSSCLSMKEVASSSLASSSSGMTFDYIFFLCVSDLGKYDQTTDQEAMLVCVDKLPRSHSHSKHWYGNIPLNRCHLNKWKNIKTFWLGASQGKRSKLLLFQTLKN